MCRGGFSVRDPWHNIITSPPWSCCIHYFGDSFLEKISYFLRISTRDLIIFQLLFNIYLFILHQSCFTVYPRCQSSAAVLPGKAAGRWDLKKNWVRIKLLDDKDKEKVKDENKVTGRRTGWEFVWKMFGVWDRWHHQNGWVFGKYLKGLWPPPSFQKNHIVLVFNFMLKKPC